MGLAAGVFARMPTPAQAFTLNARYLAYSFVRSSRRFRYVLEWLEQTQWLSLEEIEALQDRLLLKLLCEASHVPHYADVLRGVPLGDASAARAALRHLPITTKQDVMAHGDRMLNPAVGRWRRGVAHSSGTTGTPLTVYRDRRSVVYEHATIWRQWRWSGFRRGDRRATLRGDLIVPVAQRDPPYWRYNAIDRQLFMSSYHLGTSTGQSYVAKLTEFNPAAIQAYPSSAYLLARFVLDAGIHTIRPRAVFTSSEVLFPHQRAVIEEAFGCPIYDFYGTTERVAAIGTCEAGTYHVFPEYGLTELLPDERETGANRVIGSPFHNFAMPLLRYDAGDLFRMSGRRCTCGRSFSVVDAIDGRADDYVMTPDGRLLGRLDHIFKGAQNVLEAQLEQVSPCEIVVWLVPTERYTAEDGRRICANLLARTGAGVQVRIETVSAIPRTKNGKFRAVVSHCTGDWGALPALGEDGRVAGSMAATVPHMTEGAKQPGRPARDE